MTTLECLEEAQESGHPKYHEYLTRYRNAKKTIFGFVEGIDDPSFYRNKIESLLPDEWDIDIKPAGNKKLVLELYRCFDWTRFNRKQIIFFIDRDLDEFFGVNLPNECNIYVTDNYSIENDIVNRRTTRSILLDICNLSSLPVEDLNNLLTLFDKQLALFCNYMIEIMSWIIYWKREGKKPSLNNIIMKHVYRFRQGKLQVIQRPKRFAGCAEYIHNQCNIRYNPTVDLINITNEFCASGGPKKYIRGKYLLWFQVEFIRSVHRSILILCPKIDSQPRIRVTISTKNAIVNFAPRTRIPSSLKSFLHLSCIEYASRN